MFKRKIAYAIVRVSTNEQDPESQRNSIIRTADEMGYSISDDDEHIFSDKITGFDERGYDRPSIARLKKALKEGKEKPDAIFCWELSRLTRNALKVSTYVDEISLAYNIPMYFMDLDIWTIKDGAPDRNAIQQLVGAAAAVEKEREVIRKRTSRGRNAKAKEGLYVGHLADGYTWKEIDGKKVIKIDEQRIDVIKRIFKLYIEDGYSAKKIAQILNQEKIPTAQQYRYLSSDPAFKGYKELSRTNRGIEVARTDMKWISTTISNILNLSWYRGVREFGGNEYKVEGIITDVQYEKIKARQIEALTSKSTAKRFYLLSNIFFCGHCGRKMYGHYGGSQNHYYCSSKETGTPCGCKGLSKENVEAIVWEEIREYLYSAIRHTRYLKEKNATDTLKLVDDVLLLGQERHIDFDKEIKDLEKAINANLETIEQKERQIEYWEDEEAKPYTSASKRERLRKYVARAEDEIKDLKADNHQYSIKQGRLQKQKKLFGSGEKLMKQLDSHDLYASKPFVETAVKSVTLYNAAKSVKVIRIELFNGKTTECLYTPYLLPHAYIPLRFLAYNPDKQVLTTVCPLQLREFASGTKMLQPTSWQSTLKPVDDIILDGDIDVREFILKYRDYCSRKLTLLEQPSEKQLMYREREKEYQKKYRKGTRSPRKIVQDADYEAIKKERAKLYHRIEKIKKSVRKTTEEKELEIKVIRERLEELRLAIKWYNVYQDEPVKPRRQNKTKEA